MNWSTTPPTKPGFYAWRINEFAMPSPVMVTQTIKGLAAHFYSDLPAILHKDFSGEWCRLVPAEEVEKIRKEIESAYREGFQDRNALKAPSFENESFGNSRAKQIAEEGTI